MRRFTSKPNQTHLIAMNCVLGYLKHTQHHASYVVIEGYSDKNYIIGSNEVKSTSSYVLTLG